MPRLIVVFDEFAALLLDKNIKDQVHNLTAQIAMKGRAAGVHLLIGAQTPYQDVIPNKVKANITLKIGGRQSTLGASMSATNSKHAVDLPKHAGRMLCDNGSDEFPVQMPYISAEQIAECIAQAQLHPAPVYQFEHFDLDEDTQPYEPVTRPFDHERLAQIAIDKFNGSLSADVIYSSVKNENISVRQLRKMVAEIVKNGGIDVNGVFWGLKPFRGGYKLSSTATSTLSSTESDTFDSVEVENEAKA